MLDLRRWLDLRRVGALAALCSLVVPAVAAAQNPGAPTAGQLADAVRLGTVATLAPLCAVRDDEWAADLRRATLQSATGTKAHDDAALRAAPGGNLAVGALSYAEAEALEDFAAAPPAERCRPLAANPDLPRADAIVRAFRAQAARPPGT